MPVVRRGAWVLSSSTPRTQQLAELQPSILPPHATRPRPRPRPRQNLHRHHRTPSSCDPRKPVLRHLDRAPSGAMALWARQPEPSARADAHCRHLATRRPRRRRACQARALPEPACCARCCAGAAIRNPRVPPTPAATAAMAAMAAAAAAAAAVRQSSTSWRRRRCSTRSARRRSTLRIASISSAEISPGMSM